MIRQNHRKNASSAPRRLLGVLAICWLNLAIMPCAMAFAVADTCPHCPSAAEAEAAHQGNGDVQAAMDCETTNSDCCDLDDAAKAKRGGGFDGQNDLVAVSAIVDWPSLHHLRTPLLEDPQPDPVNQSPPLHKLFCVYLD